MEQDQNQLEKKEDNFYERLRSKIKVDGVVNATKRMAIMDNRD